MGYYFYSRAKLCGSSTLAKMETQVCEKTPSIHENGMQPRSGRAAGGPGAKLRGHQPLGPTATWTPGRPERAWGWRGGRGGGSRETRGSASPPRLVQITLQNWN